MHNSRKFRNILHNTIKKYSISTDGTISIHADLSDWSNYQKDNLEIKGPYGSNESSMKVFQEEIDKADMQDGLNIPFIAGGHMELKNHPLPGNAVNEPFTMVPFSFYIIGVYGVAWERMVF